MGEQQICKSVYNLIKVINYLSYGFLFYFAALNYVAAWNLTEGR